MRKIKNIFRNIEASKSMVFIIPIVLIIAVVGIGIYLVNAEDTSYWPSESGFGEWQEEITIVYKDGTTESLKIIQDSETSVFDVLYNDKPITGVIWLISGKATETGDSGFNKAVVERDKLKTNWEIKKGGTVKDSGTFRLYGNTDLYIGGQKGTINRGEINVESKMNSYPNGDYSIVFTPAGSVRYCPDGDTSDWRSLGLPPSKSITLTVSNQPSGQIVVTLNSEIHTR